MTDNHEHAAETVSGPPLETIAGPHIVHPGLSTRSMMQDVLVGLAAPVLAALYFFRTAALLQLVVLYAFAEIRLRPVATAVIASALAVALVIEITSYLPTLALQLHPVPPPPPEIARALGPTNWIRFVALDIAGFSIAYVAGGAIAWLYRRRSPKLAWTFLAGIAVFLLHLPLLLAALAAPLMAPASADR